MAKHKLKKTRQSNVESEVGRGVIKDNFLAALVTSKLYKQQIVNAKKVRVHTNVNKSIRDKSPI